MFSKQSLGIGKIHSRKALGVLVTGKQNRGSISGWYFAFMLSSYHDTGSQLTRQTAIQLCINRHILLSILILQCPFEQSPSPMGKTNNIERDIVTLIFRVHCPLEQKHSSHTWPVLIFEAVKLNHRIHFPIDHGRYYKRFPIAIGAVFPRGVHARPRLCGVPQTMSARSCQQHHVSKIM